MKKITALIFIFVHIFAFSQTELPSDIVFSTNFSDAENHYVVLDSKPQDGQYLIGVPYYDSTAGYTFRLSGYFKVNNGKLVLIEDPSASNGIMIARWQKLDAKVAVLNDKRLKELGLSNPAEFLENYKSSLPEKEQLVNRLSSMNAAGYSNLALPRLEQLKKERYSSSKFYFELIFAYNALRQLDKANQTADEAISKGFRDELILKEKHFAMLHNNNEDAAGAFLKENLKFIESPVYRSEMVINQLAVYNNKKNIEKTKEWIAIHKKEIGKDRFTEAILKLESELNNTDK